MTKKKYVLFALVCLITVCLFISCETNPVTATMKINLSALGSHGEKTILPGGTPLDISRYLITGEGPDDHSFSVESNNPTVSIEGLITGTWAITAVGCNTNNVRLVTGSTTYHLTSTSPPAEISLNELIGSGQLHVTYTWEAGKLNNPRIEGYLAAQNANEAAIELTVATTKTSASWVSELTSGSYSIRILLYDGATLVSGGIEAFRVVNGKLTEALIELPLEEEPPVTGGVVIVDGTGSPLTGTIQGLKDKVDAMSTITVTFVPDASTPKPDTISVLWYLDGKYLGDGLAIDFTPPLGMHRLDAIISDPRPGSTGSVTRHFISELSGTAGVPIMVTELTKQKQGIEANGANPVVFLPDGNLLIANPIAETLQICKFINNAVEVIRTYSSGDISSLGAIVSLACDPATKIVVTCEEDPVGITFYSYNPADYSLTQLYRNTGMAGLTPFSKVTNAVYDPYHKYFYVGLRDAGGKLGVFSYSATSASAFGSVNLPQVGASTLKEVSKLAVPLYGGTLAAISKDENSLALSNISSAGVPFSYKTQSYNETGVNGLSKVQAVAFVDTKRVLTGSETHISTFSGDYFGNWSQTQIFKGGEKGLPEMKGIKEILVSANGRYAYAIASGSKNVLTFTISSDGTLNYQGELLCESFVPTGGILSANGEYLVLTSHTTNKLLLCRIPQE